jgi:hypothetical protein
MRGRVLRPSRFASLTRHFVFRCCLRPAQCCAAGRRFRRPAGWRGECGKAKRASAAAATDRKCPGRYLLCRAVRPLAAGAPVVACQNVPAFEWATRPSAVGALFVVVERRYAVNFGELVKPRTRQQTGEGSVLNTRGQSGRVEQAPNPSFERTANGVRRSCAFADAVPPLSAAQVKR